MSLLGFACAPAKRLFFSIQVRNTEEDMSKSRSASIDASKPDEHENLASVMDAAFQSNSKHDDDGEKSDDHDGPDTSQPDIQQPEGYTVRATAQPRSADLRGNSFQLCTRHNPVSAALERTKHAKASLAPVASIARNSNRNVPTIAMPRRAADMQVCVASSNIYTVALMTDARAISRSQKRFCCFGAGEIPTQAQNAVIQDSER